jgi:phage recombination protein Bet
MTITQALARQDPIGRSIARQLAGDDSRLAVLKDVIAKGFTDDELEAFALVCQRTRLDPFAKQIYGIKRWDGKAQREVLSIQTSVDGYRLIAQRSREYAGQVGPQWCGPDGVWRDVWLSKEHPAAARVGVLRKGFKEPIWSVAVWDRAAQYTPTYEGQGQNRRKNGEKLAPFWERMGPEMLAKTAEVNAIKRGFPQETSGLEYTLTDEEIDDEREVIAANAARYDQAQRDFAGPDEYVTRPNGTRVSTVTGAVIDQGAYVPIREQDPAEEEETDRPTLDEDGCSKCGRQVLDQSGNPINDNQVQLLMQRFGTVLCRECRAPAGGL